MKINPIKSNQWANVNFISKKKLLSDVSFQKNIKRNDTNNSQILVNINQGINDKNTTSDVKLEKNQTRFYNKKIYLTKEGYNKIANHYDTWKWQKFWAENEMPLLIKWGENKKKQYGADIGVGTGRNFKIFLANNNKIDGFDISDEMIKICQSKYCDFINKGMLTCYNLSVFDINNSNHKYDWIISNRVISNIEDLEKFVQTLQKNIKIGGECFISDVHPDRNYNYTHMNIDNNDIYIETYKHSISKVKQLFKKYGFEIMKYEEFFKDNLKLTNTITTDSKPIFYYFILKYKGR